MKLLLDQDVYAVTARFLNDLGHDVVPVARIGLSQAEDEENGCRLFEQDVVPQSSLKAGSRSCR